MRNPPLRGMLLGYIMAMLAFDALVMWMLFSWQYLNTLFSGQGRPLEAFVNAALVLVAVAISLALSLAMPQGWKDAMVFWRRRHAFSSRRAFSVLAFKDPRFPIEAMQQRFGPFPDDAAAQQAMWQGLFEDYARLPPVRQAYGQYLLCYEIAVVSALAMAPMLALVAWRWSSQQIVLIAPLFLLGQYLMFIIAARAMGDSLVQVVLTIAATEV